MMIMIKLKLHSVTFPHDFLFSNVHGTLSIFFMFSLT